MKSVSLNARVSHDAEASAEIEVGLIHITHPDLDEPVRLTTDPTDVVSYDPLIYGTYSTWLTEDESPFLFALVSFTPPGDMDDGAPQASLTFDNVDNDISALLRGIKQQATMDMAVVLASTPDTVEAEYRGFKVLAASGDASSVTLTITLEPITSEPWPSGRMTRQRFPGLFR